MSAISSISGIPLSGAVTSVAGPSAPAGDGFGSLLKNAVQATDASQQNAAQAVDQFLHGNGDLHNVALATERAELSFDLAMQVRNKVVSAYQEIMKMQL